MCLSILCARRRTLHLPVACAMRTMTSGYGNRSMTGRHGILAHSFMPFPPGLHFIDAFSVFFVVNSYKSPPMLHSKQIGLNDGNARHSMLMDRWGSCLNPPGYLLIHTQLSIGINPGRRNSLLLTCQKQVL